MSHNTYFIKLSLRGVSPMVWRQLRIPGDTTLAQLHSIIQIAYSWEDDYLHQFHIYGRDYGTHNCYGFSHAYGANDVCFDDLEFDTDDKFYYEYNFFEHWIVDVRIEKVAADTKHKTLRCLTGNGMHGVTKSDELDSIFNFIKAITNSDEKIVISDILPYVEAVQATQFNCDLINQALKTGLS